MKPIKNWRQLLVPFMIAKLGISMFGAGYYVENYESPQVRYYNQGRDLFEKAHQGNDPKALDEAMLDLDKSLDEYNAAANPGWLESLIYPPRSSEIAALALSKKAVLFLLKQKPEDAVKAFKESISLNPGALDPALIALTMPGEVQNLSPEDIARLADQAYVAIHNLEMLFKQSPELAQSQGNNGKGGGHDPKQAPGEKPTDGSGKGGDPNAI